MFPNWIQECHSSIHFIDWQKSCHFQLSANGKTKTTVRSGTYNSRKKHHALTLERTLLHPTFTTISALWISATKKFVGIYFLISSNFDRQETATLHWHWLWSMLQALANSLHKPPLSNAGSVNFWVHNEKGERISAWENTFGWSIWIFWIWVKYFNQSDLLGHVAKDFTLNSHLDFFSDQTTLSVKDRWNWI